MRLDAHQCPEVLNYSSLHPSGRLSNAYERLSVFNKKSVFLLRHRYGKTVASVQTSSLHRPDAILDKGRRGEELQSSERHGNTIRMPVLIMKITCSRSATVRTLGQHCLDAALIWYCVKRVMENRLHNCPSGRRLEKSETDSIQVFLAFK
jgi:hypothetical protein